MRARLLLMGDSFSTSIPGRDGLGRFAGLAEHLGLALGQPMDRLAINAGGAYSTGKNWSDESLQAVTVWRARESLSTNSPPANWLLATGNYSIPRNPAAFH